MMNNNNIIPNITNNNNFYQNFYGGNINIIFKTAQGNNYPLSIKYGTTIAQILEIFFRYIGRPDLYDNKDDEIGFLYNACRLRYGDQTKVEEYFKYSSNPIIIVNDLNALKG